MLKYCDISDPLLLRGAMEAEGGMGVAGMGAVAATPPPDAKSSDWVVGCCLYVLGSVIVNLAQVGLCFRVSVAAGMCGGISDI